MDDDGWRNSESRSHSFTTRRQAKLLNKMFDSLPVTASIALLASSDPPPLHCIKKEWEQSRNTLTQQPLINLMSWMILTQPVIGE